MLGDMLGSSKGKVTGRRVITGPDGNPQVETSFEAAGKLLKVDFTEMGTYTSVMRPDGTLYGDGQGILMGKQGQSMSWKGSGVGVLKRDGSVSYRGAVYYQTTTPKWRRLNRVAAVFEYEVDRNGNTSATLWEWK